MDELIVKERETRENLVKLINESGLPAFAIKPILKEIFEQLNLLEQQQYEIAYKQVNEKEKQKEVHK